MRTNINIFKSIMVLGIFLPNVVLNADANAATVPSGCAYSAPRPTYKINSTINNNIVSCSSASKPTSFTIIPALPAGLSINLSTGAISGAPTAAQNQIVYTVTPKNSAGKGSTFDVYITVNDIPPSACSYNTQVASYTVGTAIANNKITCAGGSVDSYSISPALSAGLIFNSSNGTISGTPTAAAVAAVHTVTATNSAGSASAIVNIAVAAVVAKKVMKPGHFIATADVLNTDITKNTVGTAGGEYVIDYASKNSGVRGLQVRYYWKDLETSFGVYNFSKIKTDLDAINNLKDLSGKPNPKRLIVLVIDKTFDGTKNADGTVKHPATIPTPDYFPSKYLVPIHTSVTNTDGYISKRWDPYVVGRFQSLYKAMAAELDGHPALEGVAIQETAIGQFDDAAVGYDADTYASALQDIVSVSSPYFKQSRFFWYQNIVDKYNSTLPTVQILENIIDYLMGISKPPAIGGPDVLPDEKSDQNIKLPVYQYMVSKYPTNMDRFCSMQRNSYSTLHEGTSINWTMHDLFQYSVNVYGCDYILWNIKESGPASEYTTTQDALPVINANPNF